MLYFAAALEPESCFGTVGFSAIEIFSGALDGRGDGAVGRVRDRFHQHVAPARERVAGRLGADAVDEENAELMFRSRHAIPAAWAARSTIRV